MADDGGEMYLENLDEFVNDEDKIVWNKHIYVYQILSMWLKFLFSSGYIQMAESNIICQCKPSKAVSLKFKMFTLLDDEIVLMQF